MGFFDKFKNVFTEDEYYEDEDMEMEEEESYFDRKTSSKNETAPSRASSGLGGGIQVVIVKPERFEDAPSIGDHVNSKKTVILNLESASKEVAKRLMDFLSGVAYANKANIRKAANATFIITPYNVDVSGDPIMEELESGNLYY